MGGWDSHRAKQQSLGTWYGPIGSSTDHLLDQNSIDRVLFFTRAVALRRLHVNKWLLMDRDNLNTQTDFTLRQTLVLEEKHKAVYTTLF